MEEELDPVQKAKLEIAEKERIVKAIRKNVNLTDDELETLFPTIEKLREFHNEMNQLDFVKDSSYLDEDDEGEPVKDDEARQSPLDKQRAKELLGIERRAKKLSKKQQEAFEKAGAHLPKGEQSSVSDLRRLLDQLEEEGD